MTEQRKFYMKEWRKRNRTRLNDYLREYLKRTGKRYYIYNYKPNHKPNYKPKNRLYGEYYGTSGIGREYEKLALQLLPGAITAESFASHWDLEWNGKKIEVKMRNQKIRGNSKYHNFTFKKKGVYDYCLLFCVDNGEIHKVLFIPAIEMNAKLSIEIRCGESKWDKYKIDFCPLVRH